MTTVTAESGMRVADRAHDARGFWRVLLAIVAPLPWLAKAVYYGVLPDISNLDTAGEMHAFASNHAYSSMQWLDTLFVLLLVPSVIAAAWIARRGAPRLATAGALLAVTGFLAGISRGINGDQIAYVAVQEHLAPGTMTTLVDALEANPTAGLGSLLFIVGLLFGSALLAVALWRSRAVPPWVALAIAVGAVTHPFLSFNHVVAAAGLAVLAAGYAGVGVALLRMQNDDFDLPPLNPGR